MQDLTQVKNFEYGVEKVFEEAQDFFPINGTDYVELYVGNAKQAAYYYQTAFGFQPLAYSGLETGNREATSYVLVQDKIRLVLTCPMTNDNPINEHLAKHGDAVKVIALWVKDATQAYEETTKRGAEPFMKPTREEDENGYVIKSGVKTYGDTVHIFVEREEYSGVFMPGFRKWEPEYRPESIGLKYIDHMVGNVDWGQMKTYSDFYANTMGFANLVTFDVARAQY